MQPDRTPSRDGSRDGDKEEAEEYDAQGRGHRGEGQTSRHGGSGDRLAEVRTMLARTLSRPAVPDRESSGRSGWWWSDGERPRQPEAPVNSAGRRSAHQSSSSVQRPASPGRR